MNSTVGQKIKNFRKRAGKSQFELELDIDASPGSISRIESGEVNPTKETLRKIIEALDLKGLEAGALFDLDFDELPKMVNLARKLSSSLELDNVLQNSVNEIVHGLSLLGAVILLKNNDELYWMTVTQTWYTKLIFKIIGDPISTLRVNMTKYPDNLFVKAVKEQKPFRSFNVLEYAHGFIDDRTAKLCEKVTGLKSALFLPIVENNEAIGVMFFAKSYIDNFEKELETLQACTDHIASAITNAQKYENLKRLMELKDGK